MLLLSVLKRIVGLRLLLKHWSEILLLGLRLKFSLWLLELILSGWTLLEYTGLLGLLWFKRKLVLRLVLGLLHESGFKLRLLLLWLSKSGLVLSELILLLSWGVKCIHLTRGFSRTVEGGLVFGGKCQSCLLGLINLWELVSCWLLLSLEKIDRPRI